MDRSAHFSHFLVTESVDCVLPCLFLFFFSKFYRMVHYHLAVDRLANLYLVFFIEMDCHSEDFIVCEAVATAFLHLVNDIGVMRSFS